MKSTSQKTEVEGKAANTLPKKERLCGKRGIDRLLAQGRRGSVGPLRYMYASGSGEQTNRILISVPKKVFKRAVKRNLLKRRIRESWRRLKHDLHAEAGTDILFMYSTKEILTYQEIYSHIEKIIFKINISMGRASNTTEDETGC